MKGQCFTDMSCSSEPAGAQRHLVALVQAGGTQRVNLLHKNTHSFKELLQSLLQLIPLPLFLSHPLLLSSRLPAAAPTS